MSTMLAQCSGYATGRSIPVVGPPFMPCWPLINEGRAQIAAVDAEVLDLLRTQAAHASCAHTELAAAAADIVTLHGSMQSILEHASATQQKVDVICKDIRAMDLAKRHLTQSISLLENFGSLTDALAELKESGSDRCALCIARAYCCRAHGGNIGIRRHCQTLYPNPVRCFHTVV